MISKAEAICHLIFSKDICFDDNLLNKWAKSSYNEMVSKHYLEEYSKNKQKNLDERMKSVFGENYEDVLRRFEMLLTPIKHHDESLRRILKKNNINKEPNGTMFSTTMYSKQYLKNIMATSNLKNAEKELKDFLKLIKSVKNNSRRNTSVTKERFVKTRFHNQNKSCLNSHHQHKNEINQIKEIPKPTFFLKRHKITELKNIPNKSKEETEKSHVILSLIKFIQQSMKASENAN